MIDAVIADDTGLRRAPLEFVYVMCYAALPIPDTARRSFTSDEALIEELGFEHVILTSDLDRAGLPMQAEGLADYSAHLLSEGASDSHLCVILRENPARALQLPAPN